MTRGLRGEFLVKVNSEEAVSYPAGVNLYTYIYIYTSLKDFTEVLEGYWKRELDNQTSQGRVDDMRERHHYVPVYDQLVKIAQRDHLVATQLLEFIGAGTWGGTQEKNFYDLVAEEYELISIGSRRPLQAQKGTLEEIMSIHSRQIANAANDKSDDWWQEHAFRASVTYPGDGAPTTCSDEAWKLYFWTGS